jgi:hypothetical protein
MQQTQAIIQRVHRINTRYQRLDLAVEGALNEIQPGQSLLVRRGKTWQPYLREQWWPVYITRDTLVVERPGDERYEPGEVLDVLGPVGKYYMYRRSLRHVLLLAYDTMPTALLAMIPLLLNNQTSVTLALLGDARWYETTHLPPQVEVLHGGGNLEWENQVMTVGLADQVFAVVRPDDELRRFGELWTLFNSLRADLPKYYLFGVFQSVLPCGAGACSACMLRMKETTALICIDGPAFDLAQVELS